MHELLNKLDDIAVLITGPTTVTLAPRIDVKGRAVIVVEGANTLEGRSGRAQRDVTANDIDDVVGLFNLLCQGYPIIGQVALGGRNSEGRESIGLSVKARAR